jgi:HD-GYP domain-containing protein (c-di-GMP phosphodiesterase class II)
MQNFIQAIITKIHKLLFTPIFTTSPKKNTAIKAATIKPEINDEPIKKKPVELETSALTKIKIPVEELSFGMYVVELDRPWEETPFLFQGLKLKKEKDLKILQKICRYVYIDQEQSDNYAPANSDNTSDNAAPAVFEGKDIEDNVLANASLPPPKKIGFFEEEILKAEKTYSASGIVIAEFMQKAAKGEELDVVSIKQSVAECVSSVLHFPDALMWMTQLKDKDEYAVQHSLNVCILSVAFGRYLNLPEITLNNLGLSAMMMDIGKVKIPKNLLNKPMPLSDEEMRIMRSHTTLGYDILKNTPGISLSAANVALTHHERLDGKGYPRQLKRGEIADFTKMIAIADIYDSLTSNRINHKARTHLEAITLLTNFSGSHVDATLVIKFIESLGVYPPGSAVQLTCGAIAIVIEINAQVKLRPKVIIILDEEHNFVIQEKILDLAKMPVDRNGELYTIRNMVRPEDWNINLVKYYQQCILDKSFNNMGL